MAAAARATAALRAGREIPSIRAVCTLGVAADKTDGRADGTSSEAEQAAHALGRPLLILHAPQYAVVGIAHATRLFRAAMHPKSFIFRDRDDHEFKAPDAAPFAAALVAAWSSRHQNDALSAKGAASASLWPLPSESAMPAEPGIVQVSETGPRYTQAISIGGHHCLVADEPRDHGGGDAGPSPFELLQALLGACISMTVRMYADRKQWPLSAVRVTHRQEKSPGESGGEKIDRFAVRLGLEGELDAEQLLRLLDISERCPVHRTLMGDVRIERVLDDGSATVASEPESAR